MSKLFSFFKGPTARKDYSFLSTDMHSHLIPGIDDGPKDMEESVTMVKNLADSGFKKLIMTPHIMKEHYPNTAITINSGLHKLSREVEARKIKVELEAAAEYFVDEYFEEMIDSKAPLLTFSGKHILIEVSTFSENLNLPKVEEIAESWEERLVS